MAELVRHIGLKSAHLDDVDLRSERMSLHRLHSSTLSSWDAIEDYLCNRKDWFVQDRDNPVLSSVETITSEDGKFYTCVVRFYRRRKFNTRTGRGPRGPAAA